jgi:hypothetical protein
MKRQVIRVRERSVEEEKICGGREKYFGEKKGRELQINRLT